MKTQYSNSYYTEYDSYDYHQAGGLLVRNKHTQLFTLLRVNINGPVNHLEKKIALSCLLERLGKTVIRQSQRDSSVIKSSPYSCGGLTWI